jgi:pyruvate kinase
MTMNRIALETELNKVKYLEMPSGNFSGEISSYLAKAAVKTSVRLGARGIVADTTGGRSIRDMAAYRGINLILAQCYDKRIMRELSLSYGVYADCQEKKKTMDEFIHIALKKRIRMHNLRGEDIIVVIAGNFSGDPGFSFIEVGSVSYLKDRVSLSE